MRRNQLLQRILNALSSERGGSMLELSFIAPIMLLISGATIDIGRYLRYQQITSTISQELANHIYRKCSDITAYGVAVTGTTQVNATETTNRILDCANAERAEAQLALQNALPGSLVRASVFRHNINQIYTGSGSCDEGGSLQRVDSVPTSGNIEDSRRPNGGSTTVRPGGGSDNDDDNSGPTPEQISQTRLSVNGLELKSDGRTIAAPSSVCSRNRLVVVEVGYQFQPIVSFLPKLLPGFGLDKEGTHRETTVL